MTEQNELALVEPEMASEMSDTQLALLLGDEKPALDYSKEPFSYDASRLMRDRPDVFNAAIKMLAEPRKVLPYRRIMKKLHMSYHLLREVESRCGGQIAEQRKTLGDLMFTVTERYAERAIEAVSDDAERKKISGKDAMIAVGIGAEKFMMFRGEAMGRIDLNITTDIPQKMEMLAEELKAARTKRATVVEMEITDQTTTNGHEAARISDRKEEKVSA